MTDFDELRNAMQGYARNALWERVYQCIELMYEMDYSATKPFLSDFREQMVYQLMATQDYKCYELSRRSYFLEARDSLDAFMVAMEWERNPNSRFWLPRRKILEGNFHVCSTIESFMNEPKGKKLTFSAPPGCGKSTLIKFLLAYIMGKYPQSMNIYASYSDGMVKLMMDAITAMTTSDDYNFQEIFALGKPNKSAEYNTIGYKRPGDAQTINLCSIGGSITGRTRANKFIVTDDLVKNAEEARSPERLETLYNNYTDTITTRAIGDDVKEIMLGTIWSVYDPISREKIRHDGEKGYHFIALPVCDDEGHSNFKYECADNYSDERVAKLKEDLDPVTFSCLYLQRGIQKEGMPFTHDKLQWYDGVLPDGEPDKITAFCDVAFGGGDSLCFPVGYRYGNDIYVHDVVFNRGDKSVTIPRVVNTIINNGVRKVRFEANVGGTEYADKVSEELSKRNYSCNVTSKRAPNTMSKNSKIEQHQDTIRNNVYFRRDKARGVEYDRYIGELETFSFTQKNLHDDAADGTTGLVDMEFNGTTEIKLIGKRIF